jgi:hypothetical protein
LSRTNIGPNTGEQDGTKFVAAPRNSDLGPIDFSWQGAMKFRTGSNLVHRICTRISGRFRIFPHLIRGTKRANQLGISRGGGFPPVREQRPPDLSSSV